MGMNKLKESKKKLRKIKTKDNKDQKQKAKSKKRKKYLKFEDKYEQFTTYLEKDLYKKIHQLKDDRYIKSYKDLVNNAIKYYLDKKF